MLIIPVCGESENFLSGLLLHQNRQNLLVVLIINRPRAHVNSGRWQTENHALIEYLSGLYAQKYDLSEGHQLLTNPQKGCGLSDLLLLDFNDQAFDPSKGVGLARKVGADTALSLIQNEVIRMPWIFSTDADVILPVGYFEVVEKTPVATSGLSLSFEHITDNEVQEQLQQQYDFKLKYYQSGVSFIGAKYDYTPLGSTLVVAANSYAQVRGFPCRSGGEDFYILNKLAKVGGIYQPQQPIVGIQSRFSDRVPFGTGPAIIKIQQQQQNGELTVYYHPCIFHILRSWYSATCTYYENQLLPEDDCGLNGYWMLENVLHKALSQIKTHDRWQQFIHEWFDAFKILKSVHFLREQFESIPYDLLIESIYYKEIIG